MICSLLNGSMSTSSSGFSAGASTGAGDPIPLGLLVPVPPWSSGHDPVQEQVQVIFFPGRVVGPVPAQGLLWTLSRSGPCSQPADEIDVGIGCRFRVDSGGDRKGGSGQSSNSRVVFILHWLLYIHFASPDV